MQAAWAWLRKWGTWILGILVAVLSFGLIRKRREEARKLKRSTSASVVSEAQARITMLQEQREKVVRKLDEEHSLVRVIDNQLKANRRAIVEAHEGTEGLDDEQVEQEFADLGF